MQSALESRAEKAVICVVTSTHFSIGAGERSDTPGSSDALWEGEGKWQEENVPRKQRRWWSMELGTFRSRQGLGLGLFLSRRPSEPEALMQR